MLALHDLGHGIRIASHSAINQISGKGGAYNGLPGGTIQDIERDQDPIQFVGGPGMTAQFQTWLHFQPTFQQ